MAKVELVQFRSAWGLPNPSPFCMKVEAFLRYNGIEHEVMVSGDPRTSPTKKLPMIRYKGEVIADSGEIIRRLSKDFQLDMNAHLGAVEKAEHLAMLHMLESHLYFIAVYSRWLVPENWEQVKKVFFWKNPNFFQKWIINKVQKNTESNLYAQGILRYSKERIFEMGVEDLSALCAYLGDKTWFGNEKPAILDLSAISFLANVLVPPMDSPMKRYVESQPTLVCYTRRSMQSLFGMDLSASLPGNHEQSQKQAG